MLAFIVATAAAAGIGAFVNRWVERVYPSKTAAKVLPGDWVNVRDGSGTVVMRVVSLEAPDDSEKKFLIAHIPNTPGDLTQRIPRAQVVGKA